MPVHIEEAVKAIAELHRQHHLRTTPTERAVNRLTHFLARPRFVGVLSAILVLWIGGNTALQLVGRRGFDPSPFNGLQVFTGIAALFITALILITQRRENELSDAREQLTLELAILNEQKCAKIIALLEEGRRDNPFLPNRPDREADQLAVPSDPQAVLDAIRNTTAERLDLAGAEPPPPAQAEASTTEDGDGAVSNPDGVG